MLRVIYLSIAYKGVGVFLKQINVLLNALLSRFTFEVMKPSKKDLKI